eukprot:309674-Prymnesium_polylepis.1
MAAREQCLEEHSDLAATAARRCETFCALSGAFQRINIAIQVAAAALNEGCCVVGMWRQVGCAYDARVGVVHAHKLVQRLGLLLHEVGSIDHRHVLHRALGVASDLDVVVKFGVGRWVAVRVVVKFGVGRWVAVRAVCGQNKTTSFRP